MITIFINGSDVVTTERKLELDEVLSFVLPLQITEDYEIETIEAQAVIARSNLYRQMQEKSITSVVYDELKFYMKKITDFGVIQNEIYEEAIKNTSGCILTVDGELKLVPYHEVSAGRTRDGEMVFHDEEYDYIEAVDSDYDKDSQEYLNNISLSKQQFPEKLRIEERDESGYVLNLMTDENILEAETFAMGLGLESSNFTIQMSGDEIQFISRGKGHGLGFSQYGGNVLAKEGKSWQDILYTYFPSMKISELDSDWDE